MKKKRAVLSVLGVLALAIGLSAKVRVNPGVYSTAAGDFYVKYWKEMFKGGFPGQTGNVLQALGEGYIFTKARLVSVGPSDNPSYLFKSTYTGGELTLNPSGPWCDAGTLKARRVTAVNWSTQSPVLTGVLTFYLKAEGDFENAPGCHFVIEAWYTGQPEVKYGETSGRPVFQRGTDYDARLTITGTGTTPKKKK